MEKKLYNASLKGDVVALEALMREDELILARVSISSCFNQTPLHLASMLGHFEFAKSLLSYKPEFAKRLDSQGRSPLHLASANGYANIVKLLLEQDPNLCGVRDEDGRTPLHLAVMNGEHESVKELIKVNSELISFRDEDEKLLHLCVTYNRLNVLILIIESIDKDLSNIKDGNGNTILHSATTLKRMEIIRYLVSRSEVEVNGVNGNGLTALDIIEQMPIDVKTMEIKELLITTPAHRAKLKEAEAIDSNSKLVKMWNKVKKFSIFEAKKEVRDESLLIAATVIAAIAYQAAISPPGGIASLDAVELTANSSSLYSNRFELDPGTSLLAYFNEDLNMYFWVSNTISFMASLSVIFLFVSGASLKRRFFIWILRAAMWVTITAMVFAYVCAASAITTSSQYQTYLAISVALYVWLGFVGISVLVVVCRFLTYLVITVQTINKKQSAERKISTGTQHPSRKNTQTHQDPNIV